MERPSLFRTLEGVMIWFFLVVLFATVFLGRYGLYRLYCKWNWRWSGVHDVRPKSFGCFYGLHSWYIDSALFSSATRCNYCDAAEDALDLQRLEYERELWDREHKVRGITFDDSQKLVAIKLSEWDGKTAAERVHRAN